MGNNRKICKTWKLIIKICHASMLPPNKMKRNKTNRMDEPNTQSQAHADAHAQTHIQSIVAIWMAVPWDMHKRTYTNAVCSSVFSLPALHGPWPHLPGPLISFLSSWRNILSQSPSKIHALAWHWSKHSPPLARLDSFSYNTLTSYPRYRYNGAAAINGTSNFGFSHWFLFHGHTSTFSLSLGFGFSVRNIDGFACVYFRMESVSHNEFFEL